MKKYRMDIVRCGRDWVLIEFNKIPTDLDEFSKEVYDFCTDIIDQGVGSMEELKRYIKTDKKLFLWWD